MARDLRDARDRFYPEWWLYDGPSKADQQPYYRVVCQTPADYALACKVKPEFVIADVRLEAANSKAKRGSH
ncbi:MAG: hypothetical protein ACRD3J_13730 [Thermoanaerobaculia bacterium]